MVMFILYVCLDSDYWFAFLTLVYKPHTYCVLPVPRKSIMHAIMGFRKDERETRKGRPLPTFLYPINNWQVYWYNLLRPLPNKHPEKVLYDYLSELLDVLRIPEPNKKSNK